MTRAVQTAFRTKRHLAVQGPTGVGQVARLPAAGHRRGRARRPHRRRHLVQGPAGPAGERRPPLPGRHARPSVQLRRAQGTLELPLRRRPRRGACAAPSRHPATAPRRGCGGAGDGARPVRRGGPGRGRAARSTGPRRPSTATCPSSRRPRTGRPGVRCRSAPASASAPPAARSPRTAGRSRHGRPPRRPMWWWSTHTCTARTSRRAGRCCRCTPDWSSTRPTSSRTRSSDRSASS